MPAALAYTSREGATLESCWTREQQKSGRKRRNEARCRAAGPSCARKGPHKAAVKARVCVEEDGAVCAARDAAAAEEEGEEEEELGGGSAAGVVSVCARITPMRMYQLPRLLPARRSSL